MCEFSGSFASLVQRGRDHVGLGALPWCGCHSAPEPFLGHNVVRCRTSFCIPSLFYCFCEIFGAIFDHLFYFFQYGRKFYPAALFCSFLWLLFLHVCPWLHCLFPKHGCSLRCCPLPCFLLYYLSQKFILLPCYHLSLFIVNGVLNLEL